MAKKAKKFFDADVFLATADGGRTISQYEKGVPVFAQGQPADAVFYIQKGKVKLTVTSDHGKEAVLAILETGDFFGEGCLISFYWQTMERTGGPSRSWPRSARRRSPKWSGRPGPA